MLGVHFIEPANVGLGLPDQVSPGGFVFLRQHLVDKNVAQHLEGLGLVSIDPKGLPSRRLGRFVLPVQILCLGQSGVKVGVSRSHQQQQLDLGGRLHRIRRKSPVFHLPRGPRMERIAECPGLRLQDIAKRLRLRLAVPKRLEQLQDGGVAVFFDDELHHPLALGVRQRAVSGAARSHEAPVNLPQTEQSFAAHGVREHLLPVPAPRGDFLIDRQPLGKPMRYAIPGRGQRDRVGEFVAKHRRPIESTKGRSAPRRLHRDHATRAGPDRGDEGPPGNPNAEPVVSRKQFDDRLMLGFVVEIRAYVSIQRFQRLGENRRHRPFRGGVVLHDKMLGFHAIESIQPIQQFEHVVRPPVEAIEIERRLQHLPGRRLLPALHIKQPQLGPRLRPRRRKLDRLLEVALGLVKLPSRAEPVAQHVMEHSRPVIDRPDAPQNLRDRFRLAAPRLGGRQNAQGLDRIRIHLQGLAGRRRRRRETSLGHACVGKQQMSTDVIRIDIECRV